MDDVRLVQLRDEHGEPVHKLEPLAERQRLPLETLPNEVPSGSGQTKAVLSLCWRIRTSLV